MRWVGIPATMVVTLVLLAGGCTTVMNPATQKDEFVLIGEDQEIELGRQIAEEVEAENKICRDPVVNEFISNMGQKLVTVCERPDLPFTFTVLDRDDVNAFALPGGFIYVYRGLLDRTTDPAELAGVLAHEIGHVTARHGVKKLQQQIGYSLLLELLFGDDETAHEIGRTGIALVMLGYSRRDEFQADKLSVNYTWQAGYDPHGLVDFFETLVELQSREPSSIEVLLSTHPPLSDRIRKAEAQISSLRAGGRS